MNKAHAIQQPSPEIEEIPAPPATDPQVREPLRRVRDGRWIAGVCTGVAQRLGWRVGWVRVFWALLAAVPILPGLPLYLLLWLLLPEAPRDGGVRAGS